jgi:hypothetical protein
MADSTPETFKPCRFMIVNCSPSQGVRHSPACRPNGGLPTIEGTDDTVVPEAASGKDIPLSAIVPKERLV